MAKKKKVIDYVEVHLPYFKQGTDMNWALEEANNSILDGFINHAQMLRDAADQLDEIRTTIEKYDYNISEFTVDADTHHIGLSGPEEVLKDLLNNGIADICPFDDEEDFFDEEYPEFTDDDIPEDLLDDE